jgi:hypothetical protein
VYVLFAVALGSVWMANVVFRATQVAVAQLTVWEGPVASLTFVTSATDDVWFTSAFSSIHITLKITIQYTQRITVAFLTSNDRIESKGVGNTCITSVSCNSKGTNALAGNWMAEGW